MTDQEPRTPPEAAPPRGRSGTIVLPRPTPDQVAYLRGIHLAASDYDPETVIRGRKTSEIDVDP